MEELLALSVIMCVPAVATFLAIIVGAVVIVARKRRANSCPVCGARLPGDISMCATCGSQGQAIPQASPVELAVTQGVLTRQRFSVPPQGLTIGRHPDNCIVLEDELMVSRHHAIILQEHGQHVLYDRDSTNGTWINGERVGRHVLATSDRIQIWQSEFVFGIRGEPLPAPTPLPVHTAEHHVVGERFDGYYLEDLIGRGGMSEVFKARDPNGETVAIKILQETNPYLVNKFVQEGNRIGPLLRGHPNIVYVHKFGQGQDNRLYLVMEFVDAASLRRVMRQPLPELQISRIVRQVCRGLALAHKNGIVHRDIKPENILVMDDWKVKVLDFGIAKLTSASTVTRDRIVGTPEYISPEQARGEPVWPASDVYSLGIVLYEMLTGSVPFRMPRDENPYKAAMKVIRQHLEARPDPIRKRNPGSRVSKTMERITMRALEKDINKRYASANEMGNAFGYEEAEDVPVSSSEPRRAHLTIVQGTRQRQQIALANEPMVLGRLDLGSKNTAISRRHATIVLRRSGYWLEDLSKNGTWVDGQRVCGEIPLRGGAMITIGDNVLR